MDRIITLMDDEKGEIEAEILFTFDNDDEHFVLLTLNDDINAINDSEYNVLAYKYEELEDGNIGNLIEIPEGSSQWDIVEEMFNTFSDGKFTNDEE